MPFAVTEQPFHRCHACFLAMAVAASVLLSGCQTRTAGLAGGELTTASTTKLEEGPSFKKTEALARQWQKDKADAQVGLAYATNLDRIGQRPNAISVLRTVADANSASATVQVEVGRRLMAAGAFDDAAMVLERAASLNPADAPTLSTLGSAYDQLGRHGEAREQYHKALVINPGSVATRNNLAMSHALQGQLPEAEKLLRQLMNSGGANAARVRQNLALVVGLQGRFDEAKKIASEDLPPDQVEANMAYLQQMLSQPNTWKKLQDDNG